MVVYNGGKLIVYDKDNDNIEEIFLRGKTVLIDNLLLAEEQRGRYEFTGFHEGGHCILHQPETVSGFFDHRKTIVCRTSETFARFKNLTTDEDWAEWQADYFSACMKLPRRIVRMVAIDAMRGIGVKKDCVTSYERDVYRECCEYLPRLIASIFTTSRTAAKYQVDGTENIKRKTRSADRVSKKFRGGGVCLLMYFVPLAALKSARSKRVGILKSNAKNARVK